MSLAGLKKTRTGLVTGIDCSTKSLAYATFNDKKPVRCGELFFEGANIYQRLSYIHDRVPALVKMGLLKTDYVVFEGAILVGGNVSVGIALAYTYGAVIAALMHEGIEVITVPPLTWQSYIGNPNLKKAEKDAIKLEFPGKSASWYQNRGRTMRKQRTLTFSKQFFPVTGSSTWSGDSDNVGDAIGIAWWGANH